MAMRCGGGRAPAGVVEGIERFCVLIIRSVFRRSVSCRERGAQRVKYHGKEENTRSSSVLPTSSMEGQNFRTHICHFPTQSHWSRCRPWVVASGGRGAVESTKKSVSSALVWFSSAGHG